MRSLRAAFSAFFVAWTLLSPAAPVRADPPVLAPRAPTPSEAADADILKIRPLDPALYDDMAALKRDVEAVVPESLEAGQEPPRVSAEAVAQLDRRDHELVNRWEALRASRALKFWIPTYGIYVESRLVLLGLNSTPATLASSAKVLDGLEPRAAALDRDVRALPPPLPPAAKKAFQERLNALNAEGTSLWEHVHAAALNIDDIGQASQSVLNGGGAVERTKAGELDEKIAPLQTRIADLSRVLLGVDALLNGPRLAQPTPQELAMSEALHERMNPLLKDPFAHAPAPDGSAAGGADGAAAAAALVNAAPRKTLLDVVHVPALQAADRPGAALPPVNAGAKGEDQFPKDTAAVNALRAKGLTRTIGDPVRRGAYVYRQEGNTCGIAAQVEVLADAGLVPADPKALKAKEDELYARAVALGYYEGNSADPKRRDHGGTPGQYLGDLLDIHTRKHYAAAPEELFKAVSSGRMVIVSVETGVLWNNRKFRDEGHIVAITGAEVERSTGRLLGYYINDTTTLDKGRFVSAAQFHAAWSHWGGAFVEPL